MSLAFIRYRVDHLDLFDWQGSQMLEASELGFAYRYRLERDGIGWTGVDVDQNVVGCAGLLCEPWGVACWAAFSCDLPGHVRQVIRFVREILRNRSERMICTLIRADNPKAARFANAVGFTLERSPASPDTPGIDLYRFERSA